MSPGEFPSNTFRLGIKKIHMCLNNTFNIIVSCGVITTLIRACHFQPKGLTFKLIPDIFQL